MIYKVYGILHCYSLKTAAVSSVPEEGTGGVGSGVNLPKQLKPFRDNLSIRHMEHLCVFKPGYNNVNSGLGWTSRCVSGWVAGGLFRPHSPARVDSVTLYTAMSGQQQSITIGILRNKKVKFPHRHNAGPKQKTLPR